MVVTDKTTKVSVCVQTYNHEKYIRQCLQSIVDQETGFDYEVIVGDDCSTDNTRTIVQEFADKHPSIIRTIFQAKNTGGWKNHLDLHGAARGEYVAHVDGDDFWLPGKLATQVDFLERWDGCSAVWSNAIVISDNGQLIGQFNGKIPEHFDINYLIERGNFLNNSSIMYRSVFLEKIINIKAKVIDFYICMLMAEHGSLGYINRPLVAYRHGSTSSVIKNSLSFIHSLYWQAILRARYMGAGTTSIARCITDFYGSILSTTVKQGKFHELWFWSIKIYRESQSLLAGSFFNAVALFPFRLILSKFRKLARRLMYHGTNILFPR